MDNYSIGIILHHIENEQNSIKKTLQSLYNQTSQNFKIYILSDENINASELLLSNDLPDTVKIVKVKNNTLGKQLNQVIRKISGQYILYIDNKENLVKLKNGALDLLLTHMETHSEAGMIYSDYDSIDVDSLSETKLLKHHSGRLRDNQDYGLVFMFRAEILKSLGGFNESLQFHTLYDIRLRVSQNHHLAHISNRYDGSIYQVKTRAKGQNVFDYLMAGKESQLEAENVLSSHLKTIDAYLTAGAIYQQRPRDIKNLPLDATIIIPVNNRPEFISAAIESVQLQTVSNIEIIVVVNGGNDDPTVPVVRKYTQGGELYDAAKPPVRLLVYDINNIGFCLNMGAKNARGKYYIQLDSDDRLKSDAVSKILEVYESDATIGMVIGSYEVWEKNEDGSLSRVKAIPVVTHDEWTEENGRNNLLRINGAGAPRSIPIPLMRQYGFGMNEEPYTRNYGEDYDMVLRISEKYRIGRVWEPIYEVVRHSGGTDHSINQYIIDQNDEAKDWMRLQAINRRKSLNEK